MGSERQVLEALKVISMQIMELEKRLEGLELRMTNPLMALVDDASDVSSEGYESAPPSFSYPSNEGSTVRRGATRGRGGSA